MKIRFLVLIAIVALCAHAASAHEDNKHAAKPEQAAQPEAEAPQQHHAGKPEQRVIETDDEIITITSTKHKKPSEKKKEKRIIKEVIVHKREKEVKPKKSCAEETAQHKIDCETKDVPEGYKGVFAVKECATCDWTCNYEALPTTPGPVTTPAPPKKKKVVKKVSKPAKTRKECAGEKKIQFSNCLVKVNGLIAWGANTQNFDKKFEKFLAKSKAPKKKSKAKKSH
jgi:hypothetical protein